MLIEHFVPKDKAVFFDLCKEFYDCHATLRDYSEEITAQTWARIMDKHENSWGFLLRDKEDGTVTGYALVTSYWSNEDGGSVIVLDELYICPSDRGKGYAKIFMKWLEEFYRTEAVSITLEVLTTNQRACDLYNKMGYTPDGFTTYTKSIKNTRPDG